MGFFIEKIPFLVELFFNGSFILIYSLESAGRISQTVDGIIVERIIAIGLNVVPLVLCLQFVVNLFRSNDLEDFFRRHIFSIVVFIPLLIVWGDPQFTFWLGSAHLLSTILSLYDDSARIVPEKQWSLPSSSFLNHLRQRPARLVMLSFSSVISLGTFLLMLPIARADGVSMPFIDALFLATSATCVTGLSTLSVGSDLGPFGQIVVLMLIQVGGLSIMTLYSSMSILLGKTMGVKGRVIMQDFLDMPGFDDLVTMVINIIKYTIVIELWGAVILSFAFSLDGLDFGQALYFGIFHAVSAFCNAGFSLLDTSLESYATNPMVHGVISVLVVLGGLGFIVLKELEEVIFRDRKFSRMSIHSKVVLTTSTTLVLAGSLFFFFGEFLGSLEHYSLWEKMQISLFQSVTMRTAGFNTISLTQLNPHTLYMMSLFMFIGGSPGSTAGGVKTTTLAILIQSIRATLKGKKRVELFDRTISAPLVVRAIALTFISICIASLFIFLLMKLEPEQSFLPLFFETVSASATVGLSLGVTPYLSVAGKLALLVLMYVGRIGPLTLLLAIGQRELPTGKFDYPKGHIMIG